MKGGELEFSVYQALADRCLSLEASHSKLKEQFDVHLQEQSTKKLQEDDEATAGSAALSLVRSTRSVSSGIVYREVLDCMGHAVYVTRPESGEIIYWSRPAEKLYGYKESEVLGQRALEVLSDEEHYVPAERILGRWSTGQSWSGQFPFKKRSGEIFMALVTKSPLYEDGELVGDIIVSSDAAVFNKVNSENLRGNGQNRVWGLKLKKIQWPPQPQMASSVSNLASKVLSRKWSDECTTSGDGKGTIQEHIDVISDKPPKDPVKPTFGTFSLQNVKKKFGGESSAKNESTSESAQPSKLAVKVLSKLIRSLAKEEDNRIQQNGSKNAGYVSNHRTSSTTAKHYVIDAEYEKHVTHEGTSIPAAKRLTNINVNAQTVLALNRGLLPPSQNECLNKFLNLLLIKSKFESFLDIHFGTEGVFLLKPLQERCGCPELTKTVNQLAIAGQRDERVFEQDTVHQTDTKRSTSSDESGSGENGASVVKGENDLNLVADIEIRWEDLNLREEIGQGSFALVYRAIWMGSDVAVKVYFGNQYSEEALVDYKKEVKIMRRLRHPNVLLFMGAVYSPEKFAMVTEFLPRGSLFKTLHKSGPSLDIKRRLRMALDVARGMNYLHNRNPPIVHRDLKSSNLLVDKNWTVKVGDFGLSKLKNATFITARSGRGTPQWMAPEVLRNELSNEKSDVFSFGVILWELITESIPWKDLNSLQVVGVVGFMDRRLDLPEGLDTSLSSIIHDCWQSNAQLRPSFKELIPRVTDLINKAPGVPTRKSSYA